MVQDPEGKGWSVGETSTSQVAEAPQQDDAPIDGAAAYVAGSPDGIGAYGATWFALRGGHVKPRAPLTQDVDVDVCIVGGGLAGLSIALDVARRGWSVAVLEQQRAAWNASSRNAGIVRPGFGQAMQALVERVGPDHAREIWTLSYDGVEMVRRNANELTGRAVIEGEGFLQVSKTDRASEISDEADLLRGGGADIEFWPANLVRTKLKSSYYFQAIHFPTAFSLDPYRYAIGLAERAEAAGARIYESTPAVSIDPAGVRKRIVTPQGRVRAAHIVLAGNVHLGQVMAGVQDTLIPLHTFALVTKPLGEALASAIEYHGAVGDTDFVDHHYRIVGGDRLLFGGRIATHDANPQRYARRLRSDLRQRFPQLGAVEIEAAWGGAIGITVHRMPQIGELAPGVWLASGFGPQGINTTAMTAALISGAIIDGDDRVRLFEPFELVWGGGRIGRLVVKRIYAGHRLYEQWASRRAHKREVWFIANEPRLKKEEEEAAERARIRAEEYAIAEVERAERKKIEAEQAELRRIERERVAAEKAEAKRIRNEEKAAAKAEAARLKEEQRAAARAEKLRVAQERAELKRLDEERRASEKAEAARSADVGSGLDAAKTQSGGSSQDKA